MKKLAGLAMSFLVTVSAFAFPTYAEETKYPYSYDFENGLAQVSAWKGAKTEQSENAFGGKYALKVTAPANSNGGVTMNPGDNTFFTKYEDGKYRKDTSANTYELNVKVAADSGNAADATITWGLQWWNEDPVQVDISLGSVSAKPGNGYVLYKTKFKTNEDNYMWGPKLSFTVASSSEAVVYIDDVNITQVDPNEILNLDFEEPSVPSCVSTWQASTALSGNAANGSKTLEISGTANPSLSDTNAGNVTFALGGGTIFTTEGKDTSENIYELSFNYAAETANTSSVNLGCYLSWWNDDTIEVSKKIAMLDVTDSEYKSCVIRFKTGETNWMWSPKLFCIAKSAADYSIYIDDLKIRKIVIPKAPVLEESIPADGGETEVTDRVTLKFSNTMSGDALNTSSYKINDAEVKSAERNSDGTYTVYFKESLKARKTYTLSFAVSDEYGQALSGSVTFAVLGADRLYYDGINMYKDYGLDEVRSLEDGVLEDGNISAVAENFRNHDTRAFNLMLITAMYKDNKLEAINADSMSIDVGEEKTDKLKTTVNVPQERDGEYKIKTYLWDKEAVCPISKTKTLNDYETVTLNVNADGSADFVSPKLANESITDSSAAKRYVINIAPGEYTEVNWSVKPYVTLRGTDMNTCILKGELPDSCGGDAVGRANIQNYSTINLFGTCNIENLTITARNLRYPVHNEGSGANKNATHRLKNCYIEHYGNEGATQYYLNNGGKDKYDVWQWTTAWGYGSASGVLDVFDNVTFKSVDRAWYVHGNAAFEKPQINILNNCHLSAGNKQDITVESLGSGTDDKVILNNCTFDGLSIRAAGSPWLYTDPNNQYADHTDYEIILNNCDPLGYSDTHMGTALAISSNNGTENSTVSVSGSAAECLFGNYTSKRGGGGLSGYIYGYWDISGYLTGIASNIYVNNTIGRRLGDCSATAKTLEVLFDGINKASVMFDKNYTSMSNAQILAEINGAVSSYGKAYEYKVSQNEYYPQFTDKEISAQNVSQTYIKRFAAVKYEDGGIKQMTADDPASAFAGIALENITPNSAGRVLKEGYMSASQLGISSVDNGDVITVTDLGFAKNGSGAAVLNCQNTYGWAYFSAD